MDISYIGGSNQAKALVYYITDNISKVGASTEHLHTILAAVHGPDTARNRTITAQRDTVYTHTLAETSAKKTLTKCFMALSSGLEYTLQKFVWLLFMLPCRNPFGFLIMLYA